MPSELSKVVHSLKTDGATPEPSIHIDKTAGYAPSPSMHSFQQISLSPVSRVPPELLSTIFLECMHQWHSKHRLIYTAEIPHWIDVTYVCRYWRNVSLDCTGLWTHLFFVSRRWMDELLRRSKSAPLIIHADIPSSYLERAMPCLMRALECMDRVQDLWIGCPGHVGMKIHARLTATPAPLLRLFHLRSYQFNVCEGLFSGVIPGLRKVHLVLCRVNWLSPGLFNDRLMELGLCNVNQCAGDFYGLLHALSRLSNLRRLYLNGVLDDWNFKVWRTPVKAIFPQLEKLTLVDESAHTLAVLLAYLEFPQSAIVQVECPVPDQSDVFQSFITDRCSNQPSLPQSFVLPQMALLQSLDICCICRGKWKIRCHGTDGNVQEGEGQDSKFPLRFIFTSNHERGSFKIVQFLRTLPQAHLNMFTLYSDYGSCLWTEAFMGSLDLHIIRLECGEANQLIRALQSRHDVVFAPALTDIQFKEVNFGEDKCLCNSGDLQVAVLEEEGHQNEPGCLPCLRDALLSRATAGYVLQRLYFDNCTGIKEEVVTELSLVVEKVEWIPQEVACTSDSRLPSWVADHYSKVTGTVLPRTSSTAFRTLASQLDESWQEAIFGMESE